jgi:hypothetical protein
MGAWMTPPAATERADVIPFPREGFILGDHLCSAPSDDLQMLCFADHGHEGDHSFADWHGCRVRVHFGDGTIPFHGFAS